MSRAPLVRRILVTGMSGTGKSTVLAELARRGFETVETDVGPWSRWSDEADGYVWDEQQVEELLQRERRTTLFVSGTVSNQGRLYAIPMVHSRLGSRLRSNRRKLQCAGQSSHAT